MQRAKPFVFQGVNPPNPQKRYCQSLPSPLSRSGGRLTHNPPLLYASHAQGALGVAHRMTSHRGWLRTTALPERGRERLANIHPRATKKSLLNIAKETAHPSVGRSLSAGHHRLILPLCRLRLNAPPQDRLHRSNVTMLARAIAQYTAP